MNRLHKLMTMCAVTTLLAACGGGGGGSSAGGGGDGGGGGGGGGTTKTVTVAFSVVSTATLPAPVEGIVLVAKLPAGTNVATKAGSHELDVPATLAVGSGISSTNMLVYGTYSAAANKVKIGLVSLNSSFRGGEFARLTVSYPSTSTLTASDFTAANTPAFPLFQVAGSDSPNNAFDMSDKMAASLGVTFN